MNTELSLKQCFKCGESKPLSSYYRHKETADGHLGKCKECAKKDVTANRNANIERYRAYDRKRGSRKGYDYVKKRRELHPAKYMANSAVNCAIRSGRLHKQTECEDCGSTAYIHGHHDDYSKPLEVRWLCAACHAQWHRDNGEGLNG